MQYIISQEEYNDFKKTIAELNRHLVNAHTLQAKLEAEVYAHKKENERLRSLIKDITGTVQTMSNKAVPVSSFKWTSTSSDSDINEKPTFDGTSFFEEYYRKVGKPKNITIDENGQVHLM